MQEIDEKAGSPKEKLLNNRAASLQKSNSSLDNSDLKIILTTDYLEHALQGLNFY